MVDANSLERSKYFIIYRLVLKNFVLTIRSKKLQIILLVIHITVNFMNKILKTIGAATVATMMFAVVAVPAPAQAQTIAELQAQIQALMAQIAALTGGSTTTTTGYTFSRDLTVGATGADVMELQKFLNAKGFTVASAGAGAPGQESSYFGGLTKAALARYQASQGIAPAVGYFGPITRANVNAMNTTTTGGGSTDGGSTDGGNTGSNTLEGGAGSIDTYTLTAGYSSEEVGEDEEDVEVAGLEIENSDGSDIQITAVKLVFAQGTADRDFDKYAEDVAIWFKGKEVARVDADNFTSDNSYTQTLTLDSGVIIKADEKKDLIVSISGVSNLDSGDETETWTVDFRTVRFVDAQGAVISEDPSTGTETFSFEAFATAANVEFKITNGDDAINDAQIHEVETGTTKTTNVPVFAFDVEIEGNSDVRVDDFSVEATTSRTGTTIYADDLFSKIELYVDGKNVGDGTISADENTIIFSDLDLDLDAGKTYEFVLHVDFLGVGGALNEGDTFSFTIGETETDLATTDIDDQNGDALADADITGSATSETSSVYNVYIDVNLVSVAATANNNDTAADDDTGLFTMVFDITAKGGTVYVGDTAAATTVADGSVGTGVATDAIVYRVYDSGTATTDDLADTVTFTTPAGVTDSTDNIMINENSTSRVTLTVSQTNDSTEDDGIYFMDLAGIAWGVADDTTYEFMYTFDLDDFETGTIQLN